MKCKKCNNEFKSSNTLRKYCSQECYHSNINQFGENNPSWKHIISKDELIDLYCNKKYSMEKIAKIKLTGWGEIKTRLLLWNIPIRDFETSCKLGRDMSEEYKNVTRRNPNSNKGNRKNYLEIAKANFEWKCILCGALNSNENFDLIVHHKDSNNRNNSIENLMVLCQQCHIKIHGLPGDNRKWLLQ